MHRLRCKVSRGSFPHHDDHVQSALVAGQNNDLLEVGVALGHSDGTVLAALDPQVPVVYPANAKLGLLHRGETHIRKEVRLNKRSILTDG